MQMYRQILITSQTAYDQYKHLKKEYNLQNNSDVYFEQCSSSVLNLRSQRVSFLVTRSFGLCLMKPSSAEIC